MKTKLLLSLFLSTFIINTNAQVIADTVAVGVSYANQVWYSLANDEQGSAAKNNWDLAFGTGTMGSTIMINSITGTELYQYKGGDTTKWSTLDTAGIKTWQKLYNSDTTWAKGAFSINKTSNSSDLGWGIYSSITHYVTGDSLYVIKLANSTYKKLWIVQLASGTYYFKYANLDGSNEVSASLTKSTYTGKNWGYYSIQNGSAVDREPATANWDLLFGQYTTFIPQAYTVSGVLQNSGVTATKAYPVADASTYVDFGSATFKTAITTLGYNWKVYANSVYTIEDSTVYFVKTKAGDIWKVIFTGFGGSSAGKFMFTKEKISAVGVAENNKNQGFIQSYPNPANDQVSLVIDYSSDVQLNIYDLHGKAVYSEPLQGNGLRIHPVNISDLAPGVYFLKINNGQHNHLQKLIKN